MDTMDAATHTFAIGVAPASRPSRKPKRPLKRDTSTPTAPFLFPFQLPSLHFNFLPRTTFHPRIEHLLSFLTPYTKQRLHYMNTFAADPFPLPQKLLIPKSKRQSIDTVFWSRQLVLKLTEAVNRILKLKLIFRKFVHHWRFRRLQASNTEDPVTCEPPTTPIYVVDWKANHYYVFDPSTLLQDITNRLLHHDGFFEDAQPPRNPFTNLPFTPAQLVSIWNQLRHHAPTPHWTFTSFQYSRFNLKRFRTNYTIPLKLHALRTTMNDMNDYDTRDRLLDFIEYQHEQHTKPFSSTAYSFAIKHHPNNELLQNWKTLCTQFYEASIKFNHDSAIHTQLHAEISVRALPLCARPTELIQLYHNYLDQEAEQQEQEENADDDAAAADPAAAVFVDIVTFFNQHPIAQVQNNDISEHIAMILQTLAYNDQDATEAPPP